MACLKNNVGDWKDKWQFEGDAAKPTYISDLRVDWPQGLLDEASEYSHVQQLFSGPDDT